MQITVAFCFGLTRGTPPSSVDPPEKALDAAFFSFAQLCMLQLVRSAARLQQPYRSASRAVQRLSPSSSSSSSLSTLRAQSSAKTAKQRAVFKQLGSARYTSSSARDQEAMATAMEVDQQQQQPASQTRAKIIDGNAIAKSASISFTAHIAPVYTEEY